MTLFPPAAKRVFSIAWPAVSEAYLQNMLGIIDMIFIAHISLTAVAAVGVTNIYSLTYIGIFLAVSAGLSVYLSRSVGACEVNRGRTVVWHGLIIVFLVSVLLTVGSELFSIPLLRLMGARGSLQQTAVPYFRVVLGASPVIALFTAQSAAFRAVGNTKIPLRVGMEMNVIHVVLDYILIFGIGPLPGFGIRGAAWSMVIVRVYALWRLWQKSRALEALCIGKRDLRIQINLFTQMIRFSMPAAAERLSKRIGQLVYFGLIVRMGIDIYATHNIAGTLTPFAAVVGDGFATAATAVMGEAIGKGKLKTVPAYRRWSYLQAAVTMTTLTALLCVFSPWIGLLFTANSKVLHLLFMVLAIDTVSQPFMSSVVIDTAAIQVGGNTKFPMIVTTIGIWCIRALGAYVFGWRLGLGLPAVWASIAVDNMVRSVILAQYRKRHNSIQQLP